MSGRRPGHCTDAVLDTHGGDHLLVMDGGDNLVATLKTSQQLQNTERGRIKTMTAAEHRITSEIVQDHALIAIKETGTKKPIKSTKGTIENPGRNVAPEAWTE